MVSVFIVFVISFPGENVGEICGEMGSSKHHFDLDIDGDILLVARYNSPRAILGYQLLAD